MSTNIKEPTSGSTKVKCLKCGLPVEWASTKEGLCPICQPKAGRSPLTPTKVIAAAESSLLYKAIAIIVAFAIGLGVGTVIQNLWG